MATSLRVDSLFPDVELPDQTGTLRRLSDLTKPDLLDEKLGFCDGYPLILVFGRGFFCPRDQEQMRGLVSFQTEMNVGFGQLVSISADPPLVQAAFRAGLDAKWPFLSDENREVIRKINILDETESEYALRAQPHTFVLRPDLTIHAIYNGWFFVGRPTLEELRLDLRTIMKTRTDYAYDAWTDPLVQNVRIPQQTWAEGAPPLGTGGLPVATGRIKCFDDDAAVGFLTRDGLEEEIFFHFSALPGEGTRAIAPGTAVAFEVSEGPTGPAARNIQVR